MHPKDLDKRRYRRGRNRCQLCGGFLSNADWMIRAKLEAEKDLENRLNRNLLEGVNKP